MSNRTAWEDALATQAGLARRHNVQAFVLALCAMVREAGDESVEQMLGPGLQAALHTLP